MLFNASIQSFDGNGNKVKAEVVHYESDDVQVYEVLTEEDISAEEGTKIADILAEELNVVDWDFCHVLNIST